MSILKADFRLMPEFKDFRFLKYSNFRFKLEFSFWIAHIQACIFELVSDERITFFSSSSSFGHRNLILCI